MSLGQDRDNFGNIINNSHHTSVEGKRAGVLATDSVQIGEHKVTDQRHRDEAARAAVLVGASASSGGLGIFVGLILVCVVGLVLMLGDSFTKWQRNDQSEVIELRSKMYSDFAPIGKWPVVVQERYSKYQYKPLMQVLVEVSENRERIPREKKAEYGGQIWFAVSSHGKDAHTYVKTTFHDFLSANHKWIGLESFVLEFLHGQCRSGIVVACLEAAKVRAGAIFETTQSFDAVDGDKKALAELPATGSEASAPDVVELRERISGGPRLHGWDYLASLCQKLTSPFH